MRLGFTNSYAELPARFYTAVRPTPVKSPELVVFNQALADELGLTVENPAAVFSGNEIAEDSVPLAMVYAGHQFGGLVPQLGDGRAILLGEIKGRDVQLKGSGLTPYSRNGDGRAALGPMLREYLISEAMFALGIPTTRSLAVVATGEEVYREEVLPGAVLTRVAASHVRVGTFQYFAMRGDLDAVRDLMNFVIARHYPNVNGALELLKAVCERQATLIAQWMSVGFIHGVMNTDNMAISGETIDYGPCAFMDHYHPDRVFSSIDRHGRYAYANQPAIAQWNLARFAETLLSFIDPEPNKAIELATEVLEPFVDQVNGYLMQAVGRKIGLASEREGDAELITRLFDLMQEAEADFTLTFRRLATNVDSFQELFAQQTAGIDAWLQARDARLAHDPQTPAERAANMLRVNPAYIPRNHRVEVALDAASNHHNFAPFFALLKVVQRPYDEQPESVDYQRPPEAAERVLKTFCGT